MVRIGAGVFGQMSGWKSIQSNRANNAAVSSNLAMSAAITNSLASAQQNRISGIASLAVKAALKPHAGGAEGQKCRHAQTNQQRA
jgi:hypothetical protein